VSSRAQLERCLQWSSPDVSRWDCSSDTTQVATMTARTGSVIRCARNSRS